MENQEEQEGQGKKENGDREGIPGKVEDEEARADGHYGVCNKSIDQKFCKAHWVTPLQFSGKTKRSQRERRRNITETE